MSLMFGVAPKVTPGCAGALAAPVVDGGACRWNDSPAPLFAVPMVRVPMLGTAATAVTGGAVAMDGMVGTVACTGGNVTVVCAATWRFSTLVAVVAGVSTVITGVTVAAAAFSSDLEFLWPLQSCMGCPHSNAEHRMR